ncbi:MAG: DUF3788 domain-containing protein [Candidatus Bathyarchaeota archaeon]|nr:DUF3788 domain-containing protein [Candidatus Termiticorpusculum sp.]
MDLKEQQLLRDFNIEPTNKVIAEGLGAAYETYSEFINELRNYDITLMDWRFYNDGKAWLTKGEYKWTTTRGTNKVKPIFWLSIWEGFFRISFFFSTSVQTELQNLPISQETKELIKNAKPMGKTMQFIPVTMNITVAQQLDDVYTIAQFRKNKVK